ncbi:MAG TPA: hypothetical protein VFG03_02685 [Telluria sp.]|nr:hypothetical protein [Telluria sp.]
MYEFNFGILAVALCASVLMRPAVASAVDRQEVSLLLKDGESAILQNRFDEAITKCKAGLGALGSSYVRAADVIDDTGMKLIAADISRRDGKFKNAASIYCGILADRYELFLSKK